jgi:hypothetical protein
MNSFDFPLALQENSGWFILTPLPLLSKTLFINLSSLHAKICEVMRRSLNIKLRGKANPLQACTGPYRSRRLRLQEFLDNRDKKVARLSAKHTDRLHSPPPLPQEIPLILISVRG